MAVVAEVHLVAVMVLVTLYNMLLIMKSGVVTMAMMEILAQRDLMVDLEVSPLVEMCQIMVLVLVVHLVDHIEEVLQE